MPPQVRLAGPIEAGAFSYGDLLAATLSMKSLVHATIASAYLTDDAAEQLVIALAARPSTRHRPTVRCLIGSMNNFTRKSAIRHLLSASKTLAVRLEVLHPREPHFHVKALFVENGSGREAVVGSHNLTGRGLESRGELGVHVVGAGATKVGTALQLWEKDSEPWKTFLRKYREARLPSEFHDDTIPGLEFEEVAETCDASGPALTGVEKRERNAKIAWLKRTAPAVAAKAGWPTWLSDTSTEEAFEQGYRRGALFDFSVHFPKTKTSWFVGQWRSVRRVAAVLPVNGGSESLLFPFKRAIRSYRVTREIAKAAKKLGVSDEGQPTPQAFRAFLAML